MTNEEVNKHWLSHYYIMLRAIRWQERKGKIIRPWVGNLTTRLARKLGRNIPEDLRDFDDFQAYVYETIGTEKFMLIKVAFFGWLEDY